MANWEVWREQIDHSVREADLSRSRKADVHLRELQIERSADRRRQDDRRYVERSIGWLSRAAQAAAGWLL